MADPNELTMDELRERIRAAGITVAEHRLAMRESVWSSSGARSGGSAMLWV